MTLSGQGHYELDSTRCMSAKVHLITFTITPAAAVLVCGLVTTMPAHPEQPEEVHNVSPAMNSVKTEPADSRIAETERLSQEISALEAAGKYREALPIARRKVELNTSIHGANDPITAGSLNELGELLFEAGDLHGARTQLERALVLRQETLGPRHPETAESLNDLGLVEGELDDLPAAREHFEQALAIREETLGPKHPETAESLSNLGMALQYLGELAAAKPYFERALSIREEVLGAIDPETAASLDNLGYLLQEMSDLGTAKRYYERALAIRQQTLGREHPETAVSLDSMGTVLQYMGDARAAKPYFEQALAIRLQALGVQHELTIASLNNLGHVLQDLGDLPAAQSYYEQALANNLILVGPKNRNTAANYDNLGFVNQDMGNLAVAKSYRERALAIYLENLGPKHPDTAISLSNVGTLLQVMGDLEAARPYFERALAIDEEALGPTHRETAVVLNNTGFLLNAMGQPAAARPYFERALAIREEILGPKHPSTAASLDSLGSCLQAAGDLAAAKPYYERALAIREEVLGPKHPDVALSLISLGSWHQAAGDLAAAKNFYERSLAILMQSSMPAKTAMVESNYSSLLGEMGRRPQAILFGKQAVNRLQRMRAGLAGLEGALQQSFLKSKEKIYRSLADLLIEEGRLPEAQQVLAMLKEQEYFDFVRRDVTEDPRATEASYFGIEQTFHAEYEQLIEGLAANGQALASLKKKAKYGLSADEETQMTALAANVDKGQAAFDDYLKRLAGAFAEKDSEKVAALSAMNLSSARALQRTLQELGPGVVLIHYVMSEDELHLILTTSGAQLVRHSPIGEVALNQLTAEFREVLQNPKREPYTLGKTLYGHLIAPLEGDLKAAQAHTLLVYLDGALRYLPLAALYDGEHFLAERFAPVVFTAAAQDKLKDRPPIEARLAGLGLTQAREGFAPLPAVAMELERIVRRGPEDTDGVVPGEIELDEAFTPQAMQRVLLRGYPFMHIASHFRFSPGGNENDSFLLLGDGTHLSLAELNSSLYEFKGLDLLTLSACETGLGVRANGEEVEGFGVLAQKKGAASVMATLWSVVDESTGLFMQEFYRLLAEQPELNKAEALRQVQTMFLSANQGSANPADGSRGLKLQAGDRPGRFEIDPNNPYRHPYFWAPFILMGNWL